MVTWDPAFDRHAAGLARRAVDGDRRAWQAFLVAISPPVEAWVRGSRLLRRCRMGGEDDARAVLVALIGRLAERDYANLRRFFAGEASEDAPPPEEETAVVERLRRTGALLADEPETESGPDRTVTDADTPLRAWLIQLLRFCERDHVRARLGWSRHGPTRRALGTDAASLEDAPEAFTRPPVTDLLTLRKLMSEIDGFMGSFPAPMAEALRAWAAEEDFGAIAERLGLTGPEEARRLVRAGQARLREHFRARWVDVIGASGEPPRAPRPPRP